MYTLGIETSCDETAVSVTDQNKILSNVVTSSVHLHSKYGGVVPEIASRFHLEYINAVIKESIRAANIGLKDIKLIAVTKEPGLIGSLLIGMSFAKALSYSLSVPLVGVDHLIAHIYANIMYYKNIDFPLLGLVVSGGHTSLIMMNDIDKYQLLGQTQDDAVGEAFDKVAKILGLAYPGGPVIEERARRGDPERIKFPRSTLKKGTYDFSFSGIKTAVLYYVKYNLVPFGYTSTGNIQTVQDKQDKTINDICASFQEAVFDMITEKTLLACRRKGIRRLAVGGGVSANERLRKRLTEESKEWGINIYFPPKELCLDNAAMIGGLGEALYAIMEARLP